jgi:N-acetylated-alpha-linked acidic dipeptidase
MRLWSLKSLVLFTSALASGFSLAADEPAAMLGFAPATAADETAWERKFDGLLSADDQRDWDKDMASGANNVGTPHDKANADMMLKLFQSWGWDARIETFSVLYPTPKEESLELVAPTAFKAALHEPALDADHTSSQTDVLPPYNGYGGDGDVTAELVYVNYGMPDDYKELERHGVDVKGKIVIARYGNGWRGLKPKLAYQHGAVGCIIYSDPRDDGYFQGDVYPAGPYRSDAGVQRGSVADMPIHPGDPLTPGYGSTPGAKRLAIKDAETLMKIPVLPISYADALPFLKALTGQVAPEGWRGALPITYHIGPGPAKAHLKVLSNWDRKDIYDVVAMLRGSEHPDEWIVRGNHHDGWVFGAADPLSGNVEMMGEMKAIGALVKAGWRPKRTLVYASWDAEEPGLIGSTEWVETHASELAQHAVAYLNTDSNSHGFLSAGGSPSLQRLVVEVAGSVQDPGSSATVLARARAERIVAGLAEGHSEERHRIAQALLEGGELPPFLQHAGIASLNTGFSNDQPSGVYHSLYDSFDHYLKVEDPELAYGVTLAELNGHTMLRLADAELLPFRQQEFAATVGRYVDELDALADRMRAQTVETNRLIDEHLFETGADRDNPVGPPPREAPVPYLDLAPLKNAAAALAVSARELDERYAAALAEPARLAPERAAAVNAELRRAEQALLSANGLPGRGWYRHMVYAPGLYTGYGAKTLPAVREAIEERRWSEVADAVSATAAALDAYRAVLDAAAAQLH